MADNSFDQNNTINIYEKKAEEMTAIHIISKDDKFEETVTKLRATGCPVIINLTSPGGQGFSWEERIKPFPCPLSRKLAC